MKAAVAVESSREFHLSLSCDKNYLSNVTYTSVVYSSLAILTEVTLLGLMR